MQIFKPVKLSERSFFQKLFRQYPEENALKELNNLLAAQPLLRISAQSIDAIERKYRLDVRKIFRLNVEEFYAVYLNYCLQDNNLDDEELGELKYLKTILDIDDKSVEYLHARIGAVIYKKSFTEAISDGRLTEEERHFLCKLETQLQLPKNIVDQISNEAKNNYVKKYVSQIITDQRVSPEEERELEAIASSLNIDIILDQKDRIILDKLKKYWALENLALRHIYTDIVLQKNEYCYMVINNVHWQELRSVRQRVSYRGISTSFRIAKGFYLRSGTSSSRTYSTDEMKLIDTGTLYLTNKRILFTGSKKNTNIKLDKILHISPYVDGVEIGKETGKSPVLLLPEQPDIFCIILERLLRERNY